MNQFGMHFSRTFDDRHLDIFPLIMLIPPLVTSITSSLQKTFIYLIDYLQNNPKIKNAKSWHCVQHNKLLIRWDDKVHSNTVVDPMKKEN